jgi:hypothetical protein
MNLEKIEIERRQDFHSELHDLVKTHAEADDDYGFWMMEVLGYSVSWAYQYCKEPDQVDWVIRLNKREALKEREQLENAQ